jgi:hypothetical protein
MKGWIAVSRKWASPISPRVAAGVIASKQDRRAGQSCVDRAISLFYRVIGCLTAGLARPSAF